MRAMGCLFAALVVVFLVAVVVALEQLHAGKLAHPVTSPCWAVWGIRYVVLQLVAAMQPEEEITHRAKAVSFFGALALAAIFVLLAPSHDLAVAACVGGALGLASSSLILAAKVRPPQDTELGDPEVWVTRMAGMDTDGEPRYVLALFWRGADQHADRREAEQALDIALCAIRAGRRSDYAPDQLLTDVIERYTGTRLAAAAEKMLEETKAK